MSQELGRQAGVFALPDRFANFEADIIRMRTRGAMAVARARGTLCGQQRELCRMRATGEYSISDLADLFSVSMLAAYRTFNHRLLP